MTPLEAKIAATCLIVVLIMVCILLPVKVSVAFAKQGEFGRYVLGCMYCFSGGMFFGTYLMFMAPEVRHLFVSAIMKPANIQYPLPELVTGLGFFMCLYLSKLVISIATENAKRKFRREQKEAEVHVNRGFDAPVDNDAEKSSVSSETVVNGGPYLVENVSANNACKPYIVGNGNHLGNGIGKDNHLGNGIDKVHVNHINKNLSDLSPCAPASSAESEKRQSEDSGHLEIINIPEKSPEEMEEEFQARAARSLVVFIALSVACIFDTMAVGLKQTAASVWTLAISVMCHEAAIAFSLGLHLVANNSRIKAIVMGCIYAFLNGLGAAIGTIILEICGASITLDAVNGVLQAIASGTFIYTTFLEILKDELDHKTTWLKAFVMFVGFGIMCGFAAIPSSDFSPPSNHTMTLEPH
jgi:zinc transporter 1/2/3